MKPLYLRLKGFVGIFDGMGLNEIEIDFSDLSGLVAFSGENGIGKTTVLDSMHPYRCLPSRKGKLNHHVLLRDSEKEYVFEQDGNTYRTLVKIDCDSDRQEGFIYKNGATKSETNGKVTEYDIYIKELCGSQNLFFNSIFCAQNAAKLSEMKTADLKDLISEFCQHDKLVKNEKTSKQCITILEGQKEGLEKKIDKLKAETEDLEISAAGLDRNKSELELCSKGIETRQEKIKACEKQLNVFKEASLEEGILIQRISDQQAIADEIKKEITNDAALTEKTLSKKRDDLIKIKTGVNDAEKTLLDKENIIKAAETLEVQRPLLEKLRNSLEIKQNEKEDAAKTKTGVEDKHREIFKKIEANKNDEKIKNIEVLIAVANDKLDDLDKKDPGCKSETCSFIVGALDAKKRLPVLNMEAHDRRNELTQVGLELGIEFQDIGEELTKQESSYDEIVKAHTGLIHNIMEIEKIIQGAEQKAALLPDIKVAEEGILHLKDRENELTQDGLKFKQAHESRKKISEVKLTASETIITGLKSGIDSSLCEQLEKIEAEIKELEGLIQLAEPEIKRLTLEISSAEKAQTTIDIKKDQLVDLETEKTITIKELADWQYLKNMCGKDGLRALEIDSIAPIVTGHANDLLDSEGFSDYTVQFKTQNDDGKEVLDIWAIKSTGKDALLDNLSGGQAVWGLKALRQGMTLLSKEKSGINFLTALADEDDGKLSDEKAVSFTRMYKPFMRLGGFDTCFFISHKEVCIALADHVLTFAKGGITKER